ncbi:MAG: DUF6316 family protein [Pseudomonadales bacterium]
MSEHQQKRQSDVVHDRQWDRTEERVFRHDDGWYFASREGDMGPFENEGEALEQLDAYVMLIDLKEENEGPVTPDLPEDETVF